MLVTVGGIGFVVLAGLLVPWAWVPGGHLRPVSPQEVFTTAQLTRADRYSSLQRPLAWASLGLTLLVTLVLGLTPLGARLLRRIPGWWWVRVAVGSGLLLLVTTLIALPFSLRMRAHDLDYGLTRQPFGSWAQDQVTSFAVGWVFAALPLVLVVGTARVSPRRWPLWTALAGMLLTVAASFVYPVVVEPLFNRFTPLAAGPLRDQILHLAEVEHVHVSDVLVADASRRTTTLNAYVSGFGSTRRVVVYDNLLHGTPRRETLVVVAHELGHARHGDVVLGTALAALGVVVGAGLLGLVIGPLSRRTGVGGAADPAAVALLTALITSGTLLAAPVQNTISRAIEARADRASLSATHDPQAFDRLQERLAATSVADPTPPAWSQLWFGSHPTALQRIGIERALTELRTGP